MKNNLTTLPVALSMIRKWKSRVQMTISEQSVVEPDNTLSYERYLYTASIRSSLIKTQSRVDLFTNLSQKGPKVVDEVTSKA